MTGVGDSSSSIEELCALESSSSSGKNCDRRWRAVLLLLMERTVALESSSSSYLERTVPAVESNSSSYGKNCGIFGKN